MDLLFPEYALAERVTFIVSRVGIALAIIGVILLIFSHLVAGIVLISIGSLAYFSDSILKNLNKPLLSF